MKTQAEIDEAKMYGFDMNKETGMLSCKCNICGVYSELVYLMYCKKCVDKHDNEKRLEALGYNLEELDEDNPYTQGEV